MWVSVIPADRSTLAILGFDDPLLAIAVGVFALLTLVVLLVAGRTALGTDEESDASDDESDSDSMPDESEWTVSYNPPSRSSGGRSSGSRSSGSGSSGGPGRSSSGSATSNAGGASASSGSGGAASASGSAASSSGGSSGGSAAVSGGSAASSGGSAAGSAGSSEDASARSAADGSGETRLYDPAAEDPTSTDTRIFTGEKGADQTCPDCEEPLPSGTDWEFCPFCGYELRA